MRATTAQRIDLLHEFLLINKQARIKAEITTAYDIPLLMFMLSNHP
jgi:hypothetical protein